MPARETLDERARRLRRLAQEPSSTAGVKEIARALRLKNNHIVAAAASVAETWREASCVDALAAAFEHFMTDPVKRDPGCVAKLAIVQALREIEHLREDLLLHAARHVQPEPVYCGREDTAAPLRVAAASALAELLHPDADFVLADLIQDPEPRAREGATHILGELGGRTAQLLLRTKARASDPDAFITGTYLEALMKIDGEGSLDFVAEFLQDDEPAIVEQAALAIGEAHLPESFPRLRKAYDAYIQDGDREPLLLGMALTRAEESVAFLIDLVRDGRASMAVAAIKALELHKGDTARAQEVVKAAENRTEPDVRQAVAQHFPQE